MKDKIINFLTIWLAVIIVVFMLFIIIGGFTLLLYGLYSPNVVCAIVGFLMLTGGITFVYCVFFL